MQIPESVMRVYYVVVLVSFLMYLIEGYGMMLSSFFLFRFGIKVKTTNGIKVNFERFEIGKGYSTEHAKFTRMDESSCVFCHRFGFFRINTPFPIKGEIVQSDPGTVLIWRIPLGSTLFFSLWLLGWISPVFGIFQLDTSQLVINDLAFSLLAFFAGIFGIVFLFFASAWLEQKRVRLALSELLFLSLQESNASK